MAGEDLKPTKDEIICFLRGTIAGTVEEVGEDRFDRDIVPKKPEDPVFKAVKASIDKACKNAEVGKRWKICSTDPTYWAGKWKDGRLIVKEADVLQGMEDNGGNSEETGAEASVKKDEPSAAVKGGAKGKLDKRVNRKRCSKGLPEKKKSKLACRRDQHKTEEK